MILDLRNIKDLEESYKEAGLDSNISIEDVTSDGYKIKIYIKNVHYSISFLEFSNFDNAKQAIELIKQAAVVHNQLDELQGVEDNG